MNTEKYKDVNKFANIEKELTLFNHSYNGFYYWQHIRFHVCESLFGYRTAREKEEKKQKSKKVITIFFEIARAIAEASRLKIRLFKGKKAELIFFREPISSDRFFDSWEHPSEIKCMDIRIVPYTKEKKSNDLFLEGPRIVTALERRLYRKFKLNSVDEKERFFLRRLEARLKKEFGQTLSSAEMEQMIFDYRIQEKNYSKVVRKIFKRTGCKAIAFVCYYSNELFPVQKIAKDFGITTIELQHGVINNHEEYWFDDDRGINNYTPDYLLTYGEVHTTWIRLVKGKRAIPIGYPFQEKSLMRYCNAFPDDKDIVIYPESEPRLEDVLEEFIDEITLLGYRVYIKIHPLEIGNVSVWYPLLSKSKNAEIITKQDGGIYYWLTKARHHVLASTTVGLEAVALDHSNVCVATHVPHDQVQCLLDWGVARGFSTAAELMDLVLNPIDMNTEDALEVRKKLWKENACKNMTTFFRDMKKNNWRI